MYEKKTEKRTKFHDTPSWKRLELFPHCENQEKLQEITLNISFSYFGKSSKFPQKN